MGVGPDHFSITSQTGRLFSLWITRCGSALSSNEASADRRTQWAVSWGNWNQGDRKGMACVKNHKWVNSLWKTKWTHDKLLPSTLNPYWKENCGFSLMSGGWVIKDSEKRITQNFRDGKTPWDCNMQTYLREKVQPLRPPLVISMCKVHWTADHTNTQMALLNVKKWVGHCERSSNL